MAPTCVPRAPLCTHRVPLRRLRFHVRVLQCWLIRGSLLLLKVSMCCEGTSLMAVPPHRRGTASATENQVLLPLAGGIFGSCAGREPGGWGEESWPWEPSRGPGPVRQEPRCKCWCGFCLGTSLNPSILQVPPEKLAPSCFRLCGRGSCLLHALGGMTHKGDLTSAGRPPCNWREPEGVARGASSGHRKVREKKDTGCHQISKSFTPTVR